jgi:hypothetical protein
VVVGKVQQNYEPGRPLNQSADGRAVAFAGDQVTLPMARQSPILGFGWALADHHHRVRETI